MKRVLILVSILLCSTEVVLASTSTATIKRAAGQGLGTLSNAFGGLDQTRKREFLSNIFIMDPAEDFTDAEVAAVVQFLTTVLHPQMEFLLQGREVPADWYAMLTNPGGSRIYRISSDQSDRFRALLRRGASRRTPARGIPATPSVPAAPVAPTPARPPVVTPIVAPPAPVAPVAPAAPSAPGAPEAPEASDMLLATVASNAEAAVGIYRNLSKTEKKAALQGIFNTNPTSYSPDQLSTIRRFFVQAVDPMDLSGVYYNYGLFVGPTYYCNNWVKSNLVNLPKFTSVVGRTSLGGGYYFQ